MLGWIVSVTADSTGGVFQFSDLMSTMDVEDSEDSGII